MHLKYALNQATLFAASCKEFFNAASDAKFDGVEVRYENIANYLNSSEEASYGDLGEQLASCQLDLASVNALGDINLSEDFEFRKTVIPQAQFLSEIAYKLESNLVIVVPSFLPEGADPSEVRQDKLIQKTQDRLVQIARIAREQDINVGFEFMGFPSCSVNNLDLARKIVDPIASSTENLGFVVDTFHFLLSGFPLQDLAGIESLFMIHLSDLPFSPEDDLTIKSNTDRVFPGKGNFSFKEFFMTLSAVNYNRWLSVELFDENLSSQLPTEVAKDAKDSLLAVL
jgi:sugar phosphate isomerase/epimerase